MNTRELERAVKTLTKEQGRVARRNARQRVKNAARKLLAEMDRTYPTIRLEPKVGRKRRSQEDRIRALMREGWEIAISINGNAHVGPTTLAAFTVAKVPTRTVGASVWVPAWARAIGGNVDKLREAKGNKLLQDAALAANRLAGG